MHVILSCSGELVTERQCAWYNACATSIVIKCHFDPYPSPSQRYVIFEWPLWRLYKDTFQQNLNKLDAWSRTWLLSISVKKCHIVHIGSSRLTNDASLRDFFLCGNVLPCVDVVKDLGIFVDQHLTFSTHINSITQHEVDRTTGYGDMAIWNFSNMAAAAILDLFEP